MIEIGRGADCMSVEHKRILAKKHNELCDEMMPLYLVPYLHKEKYVRSVYMIIFPCHSGGEYLKPGSQP